MHTYILSMLVIIRYYFYCYYRMSMSNDRIQLQGLKEIKQGLVILPFLKFFLKNGVTF